LYKPKILYSEIVTKPRFVLDESLTLFPEATAFVLSGTNLESLVVILNSKISYAIFKTFYAGGGLGSRGVRYKKSYLLNLFMPKLTSENHVFFKKIFADLKLNDFNNCNDYFEKIETVLCNLYSLTVEEYNYLLKNI